MSNVMHQFHAMLEKENASLNAELQSFDNDNKDKLKKYAEVYDFLMEQLLENYTEEERTTIYQKIIAKKEQEINAYKESSKKKLALVNDLVKKHQQTMNTRSDFRDRSVNVLRRMVIDDELHFGNMRIFRANVKAKRAKIGAEILEARAELAEKKKEFETLGDCLQKVQCPEISPNVKREISEDCQTILKEGRKRLLALKMENRALWMKLNHNI